MKKILMALTLFTTVFAFCVVLLGAYTRLTHAGLGCPDWPGCYGQLRAPSTQTAIATANDAYPTNPVDVKKARTEMTHRYFAEGLGGLIFLIAGLSFWKRKSLNIPKWLPPTLALLVVIQGLFGMWTVTLRLYPMVVVIHLLGGFCTLGLLWFLFLQFYPLPKFETGKFKPLPIYLGMTLFVIVIIQIALGGWTSSNYAALICPDFPTCQGQWWPSNLDFKQAFTLWGGLDMENPLAFMQTQGKTAIHLSHRLGAALTLIVGSVLALKLFQIKAFKSFGIVLFTILLLQIFLGIANILSGVHLHTALSHHALAAILLLTLITLIFRIKQSDLKRCYV